MRRATRENLANTLRILRYNRASGVALYRFSSKIIPLATHALLGHWNYPEDLKEELAAIGKWVEGTPHGMPSPVVTGRAVCPHPGDPNAIP